MPEPSIAIVIPIYNEESNLPELARRITTACDGMAGLEWRVVYVDDGSRDRSLELMREQSAGDPRFTIVALSRNFGHQAAIAAGLAHAREDAVVIMDGDLQDPPELIPRMVRTWRDEGAEVVIAQRQSRQDTGVRGAGFRLFHRFFHALSDLPVEPDTGVFGLLDRKAVNELNLLQERNRFLPGLRTWIGFRQRVVLYDREARTSGEPKQSLARLARYGLDAIFSFSFKPLRLMTLTGLGLTAGGFLIGLWFIIKRLSGLEEAETGFTTIVSLLVFLNGAQMVSIGILGEYVGRIYDEVKRRPLYVVRGRYGVSSPVPPAPPGPPVDAPDGAG